MAPSVPSLTETALVMRRRRLTSYALQALAALILGQTLFFKFSAAPEPVHIFSTLGVEPWGRILTAVLESIAVALLLFSRTALFGAVLGAGLMLGAIAAHLGPLGIEVLGDHGLLFGLALITLCACAAITWLRRDEIAPVLARFVS